MTDTCNAPTTDDGTCENPTTDDGDPERCWIPSHNDPGAENPHGREFSIDEDDHDDIINAATDGLSKGGCARAAGVARPQLNRYLDAHPDFRSEFARARAKGEQKLVRGALFNEEHAEREMDGQHARFLLSTSFDYIKTERREVDADVDGDVDLTVDFDDADT